MTETDTDAGTVPSSSGRQVPHPVLLRVAGASPLIAVAGAMVGSKVLHWGMDQARSMIDLWLLLVGVGWFCFVLSFLVRRSADAWPKGSMVFAILGLGLGTLFAYAMSTVA